MLCGFKVQSQLEPKNLDCPNGFGTMIQMRHEALFVKCEDLDAFYLFMEGGYYQDAVALAIDPPEAKSRRPVLLSIEDLTNRTVMTPLRRIISGDPR